MCGRGRYVQMVVCVRELQVQALIFEIERCDNLILHLDPGAGLLT